MPAAAQIIKLSDRQRPESLKYARPKYAKRLKDEGECLMTMRLEMYKRDTYALAEAVGVSVACIYAIQSGRTKWPRPKTFFGLLNELGLEIHLIKTHK